MVTGLNNAAIIPNDFDQAKDFSIFVILESESPQEVVMIRYSLVSWANMQHLWRSMYQVIYFSVACLGSFG